MMGGMKRLKTPWDACLHAGQTYIFRCRKSGHRGLNIPQHQKCPFLFHFLFVMCTVCTPVCRCALLPPLTPGSDVLLTPLFHIFQLRYHFLPFLPSLCLCVRMCTCHRVLVCLCVRMCTCHRVLVCLCVRMCTCHRVLVEARRQQQESFLFFHHMGSGRRTAVSSRPAWALE